MSRPHVDLLWLVDTVLVQFKGFDGPMPINTDDKERIICVFSRMTKQVDNDESILTNEERRVLKNVLSR